MKLYHHPLSGHSHRAQLFLSLIGVPCELVEVDLARGAHKQPEFLKLNPFGQVPVLDDGGTLVSDSNAILVYLAKKYGRSDWLPEEALAAARVQRWLSVAAGELMYGPAAARLVLLVKAPYRAEEVIARAHLLLARMEDALGAQDWLAADHPTLADIALYSYTARAPEGNVDLRPYARVNGWLRRIEALPGFVPLATTAIGLSAAA
ncbi:MAG TPA: glutathione S-transferase family protein [Nevskia sp.]|nr:glutathione S-transferase family protein [Nevskia sp.]